MLFGSLTQWDRLKKSKDAELENSRFDEITNLFGASEVFYSFNAEKIDIDMLRLAFIRSYSDFLGEDVEGRADLFKIIVQILKIKESKECLIKVIEQ
jgi:hypothetical protein